MKIKKIISQSRRYFQAVYICEWCELEEKSYGYDDEHFHSKVIPDMVCKGCKKKSPEDYRALTTKYPQGQTI